MGCGGELTVYNTLRLFAYSLYLMFLSRILAAGRAALNIEAAKVEGSTVIIHTSIIPSC